MSLALAFSHAPLERLESLPHLRVPHFFSLEDGGNLPTVFERPYSMFLEIGARESIDDVLQRMLDVAPDFALSLTNETAYRHHVARDVSATLSDRFGLGGAGSMQLNTCLQEALANAIVHGNLAINKSMENPAEFERYYAEIESRLTYHEYVARRVYISAWNNDDGLVVAVCDDGNGFTFRPTAAAGHAKAHGRGLLLIQSLAARVWLGDDRRTLYMRFNY